MIVAPRVPTHLMNQTAVANIYTTGQQSSGAPIAASTTVPALFRCSIQPGTSTEAINHNRDTGRQTFDVYMEPTNAAGTSCQQANHTIWTSGSATYRQVGQGKNVISLGFLVHFIWDRET